VQSKACNVDVEFADTLGTTLAAADVTVAKGGSFTR
jgi:hypothetical protein